jgi:hypothetical protein
VEVAQYQLDAYNAQELDVFCSYYADDVIIADYNGAISSQGIEALRARYAKTWGEFPQNKVALKGRIVLGNSVIDHELVIRAPGGQIFEVAVIYTIADGKIARVDTVK